MLPILPIAALIFAIILFFRDDLLKWFLISWWLLYFLVWAVGAYRVM